MTQTLFLNNLFFIVPEKGETQLSSWGEILQSHPHRPLVGGEFLLVLSDTITDLMKEDLSKILLPGIRLQKRVGISIDQIEFPECCII